jgi:uncharacterized alpha/beta hydrolase family protein
MVTYHYVKFYVSIIIPFLIIIFIIIIIIIILSSAKHELVHGRSQEQQDRISWNLVGITIESMAEILKNFKMQNCSSNGDLSLCQILCLYHYPVRNYQH